MHLLSFSRGQRDTILNEKVAEKHQAWNLAILLGTNDIYTFPRYSDRRKFPNSCTVNLKLQHHRFCVVLLV